MFSFTKMDTFRLIIRILKTKNFQLIELKRNPLGAPSRASRGVVPMKVQNDATSLNDKEMSKFSKKMLVIYWVK